MRLPLTKSQIVKLGERLVSESHVDAEDLLQLHGLLSAYGETLGETTERIRHELQLSPTARIKNTGTILEKLERYGGSWLKSIQDIAGMRLVGDFNRSGQNALVADIAELFRAERRAPKLIDRRADPVQGYRAVHIVVFPQGVPIEIQVRTRRQHEWAELFEKLADQIGRGIRYGEPPEHWFPEGARASMPEEMRSAYEASYDVRVLSVELAIAVARLVATVEEAEEVAPDNPELEPYRQQADEAIGKLRTTIDTVVTLAERWPSNR